MKQIPGNQKEKEPSAAVHGRQIRNTLLFAAVLICVLLILYLIQTAGRREKAEEPGRKAVIQIDGETVHTMRLDQDETFRVQTEDGHYNIVTVRDGCAEVSEADCENQVCVNTKEIRYPGEVIACLPHHLIVYIDSSGEARPNGSS